MQSKMPSVLVAVVLASSLAVSARTLYVAPGGTNDAAHYYPDWAGAASTIQAAINLSADYDTVLVTNATYTVASPVNIANRITVRSWNNGNLDPTNTVINGNGATTSLVLNRSYGMYYSGAFGVVAGFKLTGGNGTGGPAGAGYGGGGTVGWDVYYGGVISNCIVEGNTADLGGGGLYVAGVYAQVVDCRILNNAVTNATSTSARGGGIYIVYGGASNCLIAGNAMRSSGGEGGGVAVNLGCVLGNCVITNNVATNGTGNGGGLSLRSISGSYNAFVDHCDVIGNAAGQYGGGIYLYFCNSNTVVTNCTISGNTGGGGGGICYYAGSATHYGRIVNCKVRDNMGNEGGGIDLFDNGNATLHDIQVIDCEISGNRPTVVGGNSYGGGIRMNGAGFARNCLISNNVAKWGGGAQMASLSSGVIPELRNCLLAGNTATDQGGGVRMAGKATLVNCTLAANVATNGGGGVYNTGALAALAATNTICYSNTAPSGANWFIYSGDGGGTIQMAYGCTTPTNGTGFTAVNGTAQDPRFQNAAAGDYRLALGSPCINAGTTLVWMATATDLAGRKRVENGVVDIGAYETRVPAGTAVLLR